MSGDWDPTHPYRLPWVTPAEVVQLVEAVPHPTRRALLAVLYGCALRVCEATALRWQDLTGAGASARVAVTDPRGTVRSIPVPAFTLRHIEAAKPAFTDGELMFPAYDGTRMTGHHVGCVVREAGSRVGRPEFDQAIYLRNLRGRHLIDGGTPERHVCAFLGTAKAA